MYEILSAENMTEVIVFCLFIILSALTGVIFTSYTINTQKAMSDSALLSSPLFPIYSLFLYLFADVRPSVSYWTNFILKLCKFIGKEY